MSGHWKHLLRWAISLLRLRSCIAERLIFPAAIETVRTMCREEKAQELKMILSENPVKRRTDAIADEQENTRTEKHRNSPGYALQMDVSTLGRNCLLHAGGWIHEDILPPAFWTWDCPSKVWRPSQFYGEKQNSLGGMVGFLRRRGPSNGGTVNGLRTFITRWGPSAIWNHCMNHREQLVSAELSEEPSPSQAYCSRS